VATPPEVIRNPRERWVDEKDENPMAKRTSGTTQAHGRMIKIEGHSRMIPGAEAPLNSIAQMSVHPATCSCSSARALELYPPDGEEVV
jgi:hypothetical protein